jgi:hypothetical protein
LLGLQTVADDVSRSQHVPITGLIIDFRNAIIGAIRIREIRQNPLWAPSIVRNKKCRQPLAQAPFGNTVRLKIRERIRDAVGRVAS